MDFNQVSQELRELSVSDYLLLSLFLFFFLWDAVRKPGEPWFRWLLPAGYVLILIGFSVDLVLVAIAGIVMGTGLGLTNYWRWIGRNILKHRDSRKRNIPPVFCPPKGED